MEMQNDLKKYIKEFSIVENALDMRDLRRWNGRSLRREENLSEHTHLTMACAVELYDNFNSYVNINFETLIKKSLIHDSLEILRGDILSTTKDVIPGLRSVIDMEENEFINETLGLKTYTEVEDELVKIADNMACYKFIERELKYPANDFAYDAYNRCKKIYEDNLLKFCEKYNIPIDCKVLSEFNKFVKGYNNDAGIDVVLEKGVTFLPHSTTSIDLNVKVTPKKGEMAVLCARTSAAIKGLNVAMCPIDADFNGNITAIVHNISNNIITYNRGEAFCQWVGIKLANIKNISDEIVVKKLGKRSTGKLGSTGR